MLKRLSLDVLWCEARCPKGFCHTRSIDHSCERSHFFFLSSYLLLPDKTKIGFQYFKNCLVVVSAVEQLNIGHKQNNHLHF